MNLTKILQESSITWVVDVLGLATGGNYLILYYGLRAKEAS